MNTGKQQKPVLTGQRFKTRKRGESLFIPIFHILPHRNELWVLQKIFFILYKDLFTIVISPLFVV